MSFLSARTIRQLGDESRVTPTVLQHHNKIPAAQLFGVSQRKPQVARRPLQRRISLAVSTGSPELLQQSSKGEAEPRWALYFEAFCTQPFSL